MVAGEPVSGTRGGSQNARTRPMTVPIALDTTRRVLALGERLARIRATWKVRVTTIAVAASRRMRRVEEVISESLAEREARHRCALRPKGPALPG
jgi:hypothetical protein